ncbi:MAG: FISUMP domain-containing protein [bacterium]
MRKIIYILLFIISYTAYSQSLSVFNVDASNFPTIKANFFAFDAAGNQITNLSNLNLIVTENGITRLITNIACENPKLAEPLSSVLTIDVSSSMNGTGITIAKTAALAWINSLPLGKSECAITSFADGNYVNQDFTVNISKLTKAVNSLNANGGTDYDIGLLKSLASSLEISKTAKFKKVVIFISDGCPNKEPNVKQIVDAAKLQKCAVYSVIIGNECPQSLKDISNQTGGLWFELINNEEAAKNVVQQILTTERGGKPCTIEWESAVRCQPELTNVIIKSKSLDLEAITSYQPPNNSVAKLEFLPSSLKFLKTVKDTCITLTIKAINADFNISNIIVSNPAYRVNSPTNFILKSGESRNLNVCYTPTDSGSTYSKFTIENNRCPAQFYASGGFPGKKPKTQTLKLIQPNGGEVFIVGMDTIITWDGVSPDEKVNVEYTLDRGTNWLPIADSVTGLSYRWIVPKTPSNLCLARVTAELEYDTSKTDVLICNQIWDGYNLDVEYYRNGDPIPEVKDPKLWKDLTTGAWCYYNNDPAMGAIYGKLYNWYAVNDSRGLAPDGWHIASSAEWTELEECLGGSNVAGGKLKSTGTKEGGNGLWYSPNTGATNESGFSAIPGGWLDVDSGVFRAIGYTCVLWTSTQSGPSVAWSKDLYQSGAYIYQSVINKNWGLSVRCIKD